MRRRVLEQRRTYYRSVADRQASSDNKSVKRRGEYKVEVKRRPQYSPDVCRCNSKHSSNGAKAYGHEKAAIIIRYGKSVTLCLR